MSTLDLKKMDILTLIPTIVEFGLPRFSENKVLVIGLEFGAKCSKANAFFLEQITLFFHAPKHCMFVGVYQGELKAIPGRLSLRYLSCDVSDWKFDGVCYVVNDVFEKMVRRTRSFYHNESSWDYNVDFSLLTPQVVDGFVEVNSQAKFANFKKT